VATTVRRERSSSVDLSSRSRLRICWLAAGWVMCISSAASEKLLRSTMRQKSLIWRMSMRSSYRAD